MLPPHPWAAPKKPILNRVNERVEAATRNYSVTGDFLQYIYFVPVTRNHHNIRSRSLIPEFSFTETSNDNNLGCRAAILKNFRYFCFIWWWLLIFIMKRCAERCTLQLYHTSLNRFWHHTVNLMLSVLQDQIAIVIQYLLSLWLF